jgi:hypothetical protein
LPSEFGRLDDIRTVEDELPTNMQPVQPVSCADLANSEQVLPAGSQARL